MTQHVGSCECMPCVFGRGFDAGRDSLATQLEQMRRERDEARAKATQARWESLGKESTIASERARYDRLSASKEETERALHASRETNARLHRRAQGVETGKPEDEETIRRLRREVRAMAKHNGALAGSIYRMRDAMIEARHDAHRARTKLARIRDFCAVPGTIAVAAHAVLRIIDEKEGGPAPDVLEAMGLNTVDFPSVKRGGQ